jgi:type VI secretion system protein ImpK
MTLQRSSVLYAKLAGGRSREDVFHRTYREIANLAELARAGESLDEVRAQLTRHFLDQIGPAHEPGRLPLDDVERTDYLLTALADEVFLHVPWPNPKDRQWWKANLLESQRFGTHLAGEMVFEHIGELLTQPRGDRADLASMYLLALGAGFEGKYRGASTGDDLLCLKRQLWTLAGHSGDGHFIEAGQKYPAMPLPVSRDGAGRSQPETRRWMKCLAAALLVWLAFSWMLWQKLDTDSLLPPHDHDRQEKKPKG